MKTKTTKKNKKKIITKRAKARINNAIAAAETTTTPAVSDDNHCDRCDTPSKTLYECEKQLICLTCVPLAFHQQPMRLLDAARIGIYEITAAREKLPRRLNSGSTKPTPGLNIKRKLGIDTGVFARGEGLR